MYILYLGRLKIQNIDFKFPSYLLFLYASRKLHRNLNKAPPLLEFISFCSFESCKYKLYAKKKEWISETASLWQSSWIFAHFLDIYFAPSPSFFILLLSNHYGIDIIACLYICICKESEKYIYVTNAGRETPILICMYNRMREIPSKDGI